MIQLQGYTLLRSVRPAGSNALFHAVRDADGLRCIVKTPQGMLPSTRERERYRREFGILQRLRSVRGVVKAHACELIIERPVLLLEEVEGQPLSELVGKPLDITRFLELAIPLASTLAEIHGHDVIHKDLKPSNIIVLPSGEACIIDFGSATLQQLDHVEAAPTSFIEGTLAYMSPEQTGRMNRSVDCRADFYSLGITFYELLTGTLPFHGRDALEWFHAHMAQRPRPPHELVAAIPPVLSALVLKLLAKVAEDRYQSAEGLRADLVRCREGLRAGTLEAFPLGTQDRSRRFQLPQRLYGRESQVATLLQGFERVFVSRRPEFLLVSGYSGSGKSSVVHELHMPVLQRRGLFLSGKFEQFQRDIPYATLAQAIRGLVQQLLTGSDEELARWRERLLAAWEGQGQVLLEVIPQLELITGKQPDVQALPPAESQHRFIRTFQQFLSVFATAEHPLVVFLDDLQWADLATLRLMHHLLTQEGAPPVLWLGAYRDNELTPSHPLVQALEDMCKAKARVTDIQLAPLSLEQVRQLVADSLPGAGAEVVQPLSGLLYEKTGGNPFFLLQLMVTLHQDGLLRRTPREGWQWDEERGRARGYSDSVVDFMVGKLRQLPTATQQQLRLAACVGNTFPLSMLATLSGAEGVHTVEQQLEPLLLEGLLARSGPEQYRFVHDRIQQAARLLIPEQERKSLHLRIGRLLLESLSPEQIRERLFDVVSQLNAAADLLVEPAERLRAARLNMEAGSKAKASMAYQSAIACFQRAFELYPGDPWESDPALAFRARLEQATCEFMSGNAAEVRRTAEELLRRARTPSELADVACLWSDLHLVAGEIPQAIERLLSFLAGVGIPMSAHPTWEEVVAAHEEVWSLLGERPIGSLVDLPLMTDPDMRAVMKVLNTLFSPAYFTDNNLLILLLSRMVSLSLRCGHSEAGTNGYSWFGVVTGFSFKRYQEGHAFGVLARELVERYNFAAIRGKVLLSQVFLLPWTQPLAPALEFVRGAFQHSLQAGDFMTASYSCGELTLSRLLAGHGLEDLYQEATASLDFVRRVGFVNMSQFLRFAQGYAQQMRGLSRSFGTMSGDDFDEEAFEAGLPTNPMGILHGTYWLIKLQSRFMCGAYREARVAADNAEGHRWAMIGRPHLLDYDLYRALTLAACYEEAPPEQQREFLEALRQHQQRLAEWASHCPQNFLAPERMVSAELARLTGRPEEATRAYEEAIGAAQEHGFLQNAALANELAARFWSTRQAPTIFMAFARAAREAYLQWGATGKVQQLEALWPRLASARGRAASPAPPTTTADTESTRIDALTVVKAQQAISSEIVLERLAATLMQVALENAGAQRGALLLPRGETLSVVATSGAALEGFAVGSEAEGVALPWSLIAYVKRTREHVLIGDTSKSHPFSSDGYLVGGGPRSVLCLPLLRQEAFYGVLYLENSLATNAFTASRLSLLQHLAAQAAISIENARLYADVQRAELALRHANDELERRVEERTRELKQAQERLVDTAREVGMTEVASNVLHGVGNVLTSVVTNFQVTLRTLNDSRVDRVKKVAAMLEEHSEGLADFLTRDPRGSTLPDYLWRLGEELLREQAGLREGIEMMGLHIEHIRTIVQLQQSYARTPLLVEEYDLAQLIKDALRIQMAALQRQGVSITCELSPLPKVRVDKHKVLQILINLISNARDAVEAVPEGRKQLTVRLESQGEWARIQVVDNGLGISPEDRKHLFTYGFTTRKEGHGFGLHTSALAAQLMGGKLSLESEGPGKGATATLVVPIA